MGAGGGERENVICSEQGKVCRERESKKLAYQLRRRRRGQLLFVPVFKITSQLKFDRGGEEKKN